MYYFYSKEPIREEGLTEESNARRLRWFLINTRCVSLNNRFDNLQALYTSMKIQLSNMRVELDDTRNAYEQSTLHVDALESDNANLREAVARVEHSLRALRNGQANGNNDAVVIRLYFFNR